MKLYKKVLILIFLAILVGWGAYIANNYLVSFLSLQTANPTVYIENGVSGTVTITDPYLNKTVTFNTGYYALDEGSGVVVTNNGYIITAFHVVGDPQALDNQHTLKKMDDNEIQSHVEQAAVNEYLSNYNSQFGNELINSSAIVNHANLNTNISFITGLLVQKHLINVKSDEQVIKVKLRTSTRIASLNAQLVDVGDGNIDDDVALLKINADNIPALSISSQKPIIGESIRIYGYPGNDIQTRSLIPSITAGQLIASMPNSFGTIYYQTNAIAAPGYSGGPVLNNKSKVIGIVIYEIESLGNFNQQIGSQSTLFLSSNYIIQICNKNNVPITVLG